MRPAVRAHTVLLVFICWAVMNVLLYFGLEWQQAAKPLGIRQPTRLSLSSFKPNVNRPVSSDLQASEALPYRLMSPVKTKPGERYPLLVFLHGAGEKGDENQTQLLGLPEQMAESAWRKRFPCFLLAPQCPAQSYWTNLDHELLDLIRDVMRRHPVDPERVYLTGLSMGAYGCWDLAVKEPELFAAVVPICGGGEPASANRLVNIPVWAVHGDADRAVPVEQSRTMISAIREAGGHPRYTELNGIGHDSWTQTYRDPNGVLQWMFEQRNGSVGKLNVR